LRKDPEGSEFATIEQAAEEAVRSAQEILAEKVSQGRVVDGQVFEITDEEGTVRATIPFRSVLRLE
jgi:ribosomal protein L35AE/L33A